LAEQFSDIPSGMMPIFATDMSNAPIELYSGPITIHTDNKTTANDARIYFTWLPEPEIVADVIPDSELDFKLFGFDNTISLKIDKLNIETNAIGTFLTIGNESSMVLHLHPCVMNTASECSNMMFQVVNFTNYMGTAISFTQNSYSRGRMELSTDGWQIILDQTPNCSDLEKQLKKDGGYAITHTGRIERVDGSSFSIADGHRIIDRIRLFLSFCRGRFVGIPFIRGIDSSGNHVYEEWLPAIVSPWKGVRSWLPEHNIGDVTKAFCHFNYLCNNQDWYDSILAAIHWYIFANENLTRLEGSIALAQIAMERLSWMKMVIDQCAISQDGFNRLCASDNFNILFNHLGIPRGIPSELHKLCAYCKSSHISSLSECITQFRNDIVHPPKKNKTSPDKDTLYEAYNASIWALELVILALIQYRGQYVSRVNPKIIWTGQSELVPWVVTQLPG